MANTAITEDLVSKVEKILALKDHDNTTEEEIDAAMGAVGRLLAKNNITHEEMSKFIEKRVGFNDERYKCGNRKITRWKSSLIQNSAEFFFCAAYNSYGGNVIITGKREDRETFVKMIKYLESCIDDLAIKAVKEYDGWVSKKTYGTNFRQGCVDRIISRLREQNKNILEAHYSKCAESGIVVYNPYVENAKKIGEHWKSSGLKLTTTAPSRSTYSATGYAKGTEAGNTIGLNNNGALPSR